MAVRMCRPLRVLSWNMCCLTHPLSASWPRIAIGALVGRSWHDEARDSTIRPLDAHNVARLERQAEYILRSESDVVLLQEVPGVATLSKILEYLSRDDRPATSPSPAAAHGDGVPAEGHGGYEALYATQRPLAASYVAYTAFAFFLGLAQATTGLALGGLLSHLAEVLVPLLLGDCSAASISARELPAAFSGTVIALGALNAAHWRHSVVGQFFLGSIAGQLVVLVRRSSPLLASSTSADRSADHPLADRVMTPSADANVRFKAYDGGAFAASASRALQCLSPHTTVLRDARRRSVSSTCTTLSCDDDPAAARRSIDPTAGACDPTADTHGLPPAHLPPRSRPTTPAAYTAPAVRTPALLRVFFSLRARGVLTARLRLKSGAELAVLNTHMPHKTDNTARMWRLGEMAADAAADGAHVVLGGDFNPLASVPTPAQFAPLLAHGNVPTHAFEAPAYRTWDHTQPLTRAEGESTRDMQLDFIFVQPRCAAVMHA